MIKSFRGKYSFLSNFYSSPVKFDGITYQNSEAAFQAQKCRNYEDRSKFANLNPSDAKRLGRSVKLREDWEQEKVNIMHAVVYEKFKQNPQLRERLLTTGDAYLEEGNTWGDRTWGTVNGSGSNFLGRILMDVRSKLRA